MTFRQILFLMWMKQGCTENSYHQELVSQGKKNGTWLQSIQGPTYSAPWREHIRNSKIKAITGESLWNSQSNERHSKISFASHLDFQQKGLDHATNILRMVFQALLP